MVLGSREGGVARDGAADDEGLDGVGAFVGVDGFHVGVVAGDVVVEFDGKPVTDLYTYTDALYARAPGDTVPVVVMRGGARVEAKVTLGKRGE